MAQKNGDLLSALSAARVDFVVIGGVAANVHGASLVTKDLDVVTSLVVTSLTVDNCTRILSALLPFEPCFYQTIGRPKVERTAQQLAEFRNLYFDTRIGRIDLLGSLPPVGTFERVASAALTVELLGVTCKLISLDDLIAVKAFVGRPKDQATEIELRAIREALMEGR